VTDTGTVVGRRGLSQLKFVK